MAAACLSAMNAAAAASEPWVPEMLRATPACAAHRAKGLRAFQEENIKQCKGASSRAAAEPTQ